MRWFSLLGVAVPAVALTEPIVHDCAHRPLFGPVFEAALLALEACADVDGVLVADVTVDARTVTMRTSSDLPVPVVACARAVVEGMVFPDTGTPHVLRYPFTFSSGTVTGPVGS